MRLASTLSVSSYTKSLTEVDENTSSRWKLEQLLLQPAQLAVIKPKYF